MLIVDVLDAVVVQSQTLQVLKVTELNDFIPRLDVVTFEVDEFKELEVVFGDGVFAADQIAVVAHQVQLLDVAEGWCQ